MTPHRRTLLLTAAAVVVVAIVGAALFVVPNLNDDTAPPAPSAAPSITSSPPAPGNTGVEGFGTPTSDLSGRIVMVPNNPAGQPLPQREPSRPRTECTPDGQPVTSPEKVMIQDNFGADTLYSETDGPSRLDGLVLVGYSHTPQGAALAAANIFPRYYRGGPVAAEVVQKLTFGFGGEFSSDDVAAAAQQPIKTDRYYVRAPNGFRILSCSDDFAVVELALIRDVDDTGRPMTPIYAGLRLNMVWDNDMWKVRQSDRGVFGPYTSLDGFTRWTS